MSQAEAVQTLYNAAKSSKETVAPAVFMVDCNYSGQGDTSNFSQHQ